MKRISAFIFLLLGFMAIAAVQEVHAAILNKEISRVYELSDQSVLVTETTVSRITNPQYLIPSGSEEIFTIFNPIINDSEANSKIDKTIPTIQVTDQSGRKLNFTTKRDGQNLLVSVKRPRNIVYGTPQTIRIKYESFALSSVNGALIDMYIPAFSKSFNFVDSTTSRTYRTTAIIPKRFGEQNFVVPKVPIQDRGNVWEMKFSQKQLTGIISWIQIGTTQFYDFKIEQEYQSSTTIPLFFNTYDVILPREVSAGPITQDVIFTNITPEPDKVVLDENQNVIATFKVPANTSGRIVIQGYSTVRQDQEFNITEAGQIGEVDEEEMQRYLSAAEFWESDNPQIVSTSEEITKGETDVYKIIEKTYKYVVDKIDYSNIKRFGINERQGALKTLQGGAAVCMEYSDLFIALMRAQGVPARAAFGYGYDSRSTGGDQTAHQWAEVYLPKQDTWIGVDTTWGEAGPAIIGGDLNHFYKYVASKNPLTPSPVSLTYFGTTPVIQDEKFEISAIERIPDEISYQTSQDLLAKYPEQSGLIVGVENVLESIIYTIQSIDFDLDVWLIENLNVSQATSTILRFILYLTPVALVIGLGTYLRLRKTRVDTITDPSKRLYSEQPAE